MSAFETFVNRELPRRSALLTVAITGYDGEPTNVAAPAILQSSPIGTEYIQETPQITFWRKNNTGAFDWIQDDPGGGGGGGGGISLDGGAFDQPPLVDPGTIDGGSF